MSQEESTGSVPSAENGAVESRNPDDSAKMLDTKTDDSMLMPFPIPKMIGDAAAPPDTRFRAVHQIRLSSLSHNYNCVESTAAQQKCSVIVVVKADGYGHGAVATALHLVNNAGADSFAVATLEEGIELRKALEKKNAKQPNVRILVLGPPVGYPRCFDDYYYFNIELMVSGPEVATALLAWVADEEGRKRSFVERVAAEAKAEALTGRISRHPSDAPDDEEDNDVSVVVESSTTRDGTKTPPPQAGSCATLSTVSGQDLANEVKRILLTQQQQKQQQQEQQKKQPKTNGHSSPKPILTSDSTTVESTASKNAPSSTSSKTSGKTFGGIEAAANKSRNREKAAKATEVFSEDSDHSTEVSSLTTMNGRKRPRRQLRWHALIDSGMGRLGFKTETADATKNGGRDSVMILKDLVDSEVVAGAPLEFFGMCTHMAEASSTSDYTNSQIVKFKSLLRRVREAGISVPTVSTDNSAALLTPTLQHFDPDEILSQPDMNTRGYVRTGGAIYGQRPAFTQLKAISTLHAAVRHVAILRQGESVGYDRAYVAPTDVRIATLTIGFADGYPRELGNGLGKVAIRGSIFPIAGNVCMDMLMVELGAADDTDGIGAQVKVGDVAVLWGPLHEKDGEGLIRLKDIAATLSTTQSALTCGLNKTRVLRGYV